MTPLEKLKRRSIEDFREEPQFFQALLDATVFVHAPVSDDHSRLRLLQFVRPDGLTVLPFFSRQEEAERAAQHAARVITLTGRQLFELTRGAILMLDPNETSCTLYPEEIAALLDDGTVARIEFTNLAEGEQLELQPGVVPTAILDIVREELRRLPAAETAYLARIRKAHADLPFSVLIVVMVAARESEHVVRALATRLQTCGAELDEAIDLATFDPAEGTPSWLSQASLDPFYAR